MLITSGMTVGLQCPFFKNLYKIRDIVFYEKYNKNGIFI